MTLPPDRLRDVAEYRARNDRPGTGQYIWPSVRIRKKEYSPEWRVTAEPSTMDLIIDWKVRSPAMKLRVSASERADTSQQSEEDQLIRQYTIELRVNYADSDKNEVMRQAISQAAVHIMATANLLADGVKPDIACLSDDWFSGKEEINALEDVLGKGLQERGESTAQSETVSSELMAAVRDSQ